MSESNSLLHESPLRLERGSHCIGLSSFGMGGEYRSNRKSEMAWKGTYHTMEHLASLTMSMIFLFDRRTYLGW